MNEFGKNWASGSPAGSAFQRKLTSPAPSEAAVFTAERGASGVPMRRRMSRLKNLGFKMNPLMSLAAASGA